MLRINVSQSSDRVTSCLLKYLHLIGVLHYTIWKQLFRHYTSSEACQNQTLPMSLCSSWADWTHSCRSSQRATERFGLISRESDWRFSRKTLAQNSKRSDNVKQTIARSYHTSVSRVHLGLLRDGQSRTEPDHGREQPQQAEHLHDPRCEECGCLWSRVTQHELTPSRPYLLWLDGITNTLLEKIV